MAIISWREQMSLDYPPLDTEHKAFLNVINQASVDVKLQHIDGMEKMFAACYDYVRNHFSHEEDIMERIRFPDLEAHIASHQIFIKNISQFRQEFETADTKGKKIDAAQKAMNFLSIWFLGHLLSRDKPVKPYLTRLRNLPPRMNY